MGNTTRNTKNKEKKAIEGKVIEMLSSGKTYKEISQIQGAKSSKTIARIAKSNAEVIAKKKAEYLRLIDNITGGDKRQAQKLGELLDATEPVYSAKGEYLGDRPNAKIQLDTVKYIDKLKGRDQAPSQGITNNNLIISRDLDKFTKG